MKIKNFKYKNIGIYIKNIIFIFFKNINKDISEKNENKINKIMKNINQSNISSKIKRINDLFKKSESDPFLCKAVAAYEMDLAKNPEDGFKKIKKYNFLIKKWIEKNNLNYIKTEFIPESLVMGALGNHLPLFHYLMYKINIERSTEKPNLLLKTNQKITNSALYNYFTPYLNIIQNDSKYYKLQSISRIFKTPMEGTLPFKDNYYPFFASVNFINQSMKNLKNKKFDYFKINNTDFKKGKNILKELGVPEDAWYVTLHVREGVKNELFNSNPLTYVKAIKEITKRGGYVFRMGDRSMTPLPKMYGVIDYPFTKYKSEFFDIFLASTCRFCIGTSSGYWSIPTFFGKPVLLTNYLPFLDYYLLQDKSLFLPKRFVDRNTKKTVALENLFKFPLGSLTTNIQLDQNNIDITDNSEDEISQSTVEMLNSLDGKINNQRFTIVNDDFKKKLDILNNDKYEFPLKAMANMSTSFFNKN